ncbi:hypothetical protein ACFQH2_09825 [Natronoarchaeum sp. GCM10025703]|uniref:DUF7550 family protein n=1 Tax=unclassified Natronoarchaeum TaxID=2620183 RepID=UPI003611716D
MTDADDEADDELAVDQNPSKTDVPFGEGSEDDEEFEEPESTSEPTESDEDADSPATVEGRTTAPQSAYSNRQALIGGLITAVGLVVAFGIPLLL